MFQKVAVASVGLDEDSDWWGGGGGVREGEGGGGGEVGVRGGGGEWGLRGSILVTPRGSLQRRHIITRNKIDR